MAPIPSLPTTSATCSAVGSSRTQICATTSPCARALPRWQQRVGHGTADRAHVGGALDVSGAVVESWSDPQHRWALDGLTYPRLPSTRSGRAQLGWLDL